VEELRHVTHHCEELTITNRENQLTIVKLQNKIDMLAAKLKSAREDYDADLNQEKNKHTVTKSWRKNLYTTLENMQTDLLCSSPEETV
jgi:uncharacterized coiled-coil protein SlyX